jgi:hypothetical protein
MMEITLTCPSCGRALPFSAADGPGEVRCGACHRHVPLSISDGVRGDSAVDVCPVCEGSDFYARKDFDPKLGLTVVIVGALISAGFYFYGLDLVAYGILGGAALIDLVVYGRLPEVTVCYRCHTEFRGTYRRTAPAFDLHTADVLELEWARRAGHRQKEPSR